MSAIGPVDCGCVVGKNLQRVSSTFERRADQSISAFILKNPNITYGAWQKENLRKGRHDNEKRR